jgi:hypothetical protein
VILHWIGQIIGGVITFIPLAVCGVIFGLMFINVFETAYSPSDSVKVPKPIENTVVTIGGVVGVVIGWLLLVEILSYWIKLGVAGGTVKGNLQNIVSSWLLIIIVFTALFVIHLLGRFVGWISFKFSHSEESPDMKTKGQEMNRIDLKIAVADSLALIIVIALSVWLKH